MTLYSPIMKVGFYRALTALNTKTKQQFIILRRLNSYNGDLTNHSWTAEEGQQPVDQSFQLLYDNLWWVDEDGLQTGQSCQMNVLIRTRQGLQQQRKKLHRNRTLMITGTYQLESFRTSIRAALCYSPLEVQ